MKQEIKELRKAIDFTNRVFPLPRCVHGNALKSHAGENLFPTCGCSYDKELENCHQRLKN